jgi:MFS family permease
MVIGTATATLGLLLATRIGVSTSYFQIVVSLVLIGAGSGMTFVSLTTASLADVEPDVAGAASGLVNVSQQIGAAVGLAVLVTAFNSLAGHVQIASGVDSAHIVHSFDLIFGASALFSLASLVTVLAGVRLVRGAQPGLAEVAELELPMGEELLVGSEEGALALAAAEA